MQIIFYIFVITGYIDIDDNKDSQEPEKSLPETKLKKKVHVTQGKQLSKTPVKKVIKKHPKSPGNKTVKSPGNKTVKSSPVVTDLKGRLVTKPVTRCITSDTTAESSDSSVVKKDKTESSQSTLPLTRARIAKSDATDNQPVQRTTRSATTTEPNVLPSTKNVTRSGHKAVSKSSKNVHSKEDAKSNEANATLEEPTEKVLIINETVTPKCVQKAKAMRKTPAKAVANETTALNSITSTTAVTVSVSEPKKLSTDTLANSVTHTLPKPATDASVKPVTETFLNPVTNKLAKSETDTITMQAPDSTAKPNMDSYVKSIRNTKGKSSTTAEDCSIIKTTKQSANTVITSTTETLSENKKKLSKVSINTVDKTVTTTTAKPHTSTSVALSKFTPTKRPTNSTEKTQITKEENNNSNISRKTSAKPIICTAEIASTSPSLRTPNVKKEVSLTKSQINSSTKSTETSSTFKKGSANTASTINVSRKSSEYPVIKKEPVKLNQYATKNLQGPMKISVSRVSKTSTNPSTNTISTGQTQQQPVVKKEALGMVETASQKSLHTLISDLTTDIRLEKLNG